MFDNTDPTQVADLKSEITNDPSSIGYNTTQGVAKDILKLINLAENNTTNAKVNRPVEEIKISEVAAVISDTEYSLLSDYHKEWLKMFISRTSDESVNPYVDKFLQLFPNGTDTRTAVLALRVKDASRAEELFGVNTVITRDDLAAAKGAQ